MGAQVLTREVQIQGVMYTPTNAFVQAHLNDFAKTVKQPLFRQHVWKPCDFNPNVKTIWTSPDEKCHWSLIISMVLQNL